MKEVLFGLLLIVCVAGVEEQVQYTMDDLIETLRGVFEAWDTDKEEVDRLLLCVSNLKDIEGQIAKIMEELRHIDVHDIVKLIEAVARLLIAVQQLFKDIEPCIDSTGEIIKLVQKIIKLTPIELLLKLFQRIMSDSKIIYNDIIEAIDAYKKKEYYRFGFKLGDAIWRLLLKD